MTRAGKMNRTLVAGLIFFKIDARKGGAVIKMTKRTIVYVAALVAIFFPLSLCLANVEEMVKVVPGRESSPGGRGKVIEGYGKLPLSFVRNNGQVDGRVIFYEKSGGHTTFFTKEGIYLSLTKNEGAGIRKKDRRPQFRILNSKSEVIKLTLLGANKDPEIIAEGLQGGKVNYFIGNDPEKWKTNIATYGSVVYKEVYKGVDIRYYGNNRQLEYDIIVKPGADPRVVKLSYEGIEGLRVTEQGDLEIRLKEGTIIQRRPHIYQEVGGKRVEVAGKFKVESSEPEAKNTKFSYAFEMAPYNKEHPLIIDPVLVSSTYLGGSEDDGGYGIAVDSSGYAYITGNT